MWIRYAIKAMLTTTVQSALRGTFDAAKKVIPQLIAHKVSTAIQNASKKRKRK